MIRKPERPISLISHKDSIDFWKGDDMKVESGKDGAMLIFPCFYSGYVETDDERIIGIIEEAFRIQERGSQQTFELDSPGEFAQLDHEHCVVCRRILSCEYNRPLVLRIIVAPSSTQNHQWGVFINHGGACWDCWRSLCSVEPQKMRLWHAEVDDNHLEYIEHYARKHLGPPPTNSSELKRIVVDAVASMNRGRSSDSLLRDSVVSCPLLWDYHKLILKEDDDDKEN